MATVPIVITMPNPTDWPSYLAEFHATNAGITEDVLNGCSLHGRSPYAWLTETVDPSRRILDLACGSGPAKPNGAQQWIGLDLSAAELARARSGGNGTLIRGDATALPIPDANVDTVTCSMALMLVQPLDRALAELHRVLKPGGHVLLLLPAHRPLRVADRLAYLRLFFAARSTTKFPPSALRRHAAESLARHGMLIESDQSRRFTYWLAKPSDADLLCDSWYLPGVSPRRRGAARDRARAMIPGPIGIPLRRIIARRSP